MKPKKITKWLGVSSSVLLLAFASTNPAQAQWTGADVGTPTHHGSVVTNADGSLNINGGGDDIWNAKSDYYYYYTWANSPSWNAQFKVDKDIVGGDASWAKCELLVDVADPAAGPAGGDAFLAMMYTKPSNTHLCDQFRTVSGGAADEYTTPGLPAYQPPVWMDIMRQGTLFKLFYSLDNRLTWNNYVDIDTATNAWVGNDNATYFGSAFPDSVTVGVAVTAHNDADTVGATATVSGLSLTPIAGPTAFGISSQPKNATNYAGCEVSFSLGTTNNASQPSLVSYQWHKNGTAVAGATGSAFTYLINPSDPSENGAQVYCVATIGPPTGITGDSLPPVTSSVATAGVLPGVTYYTNGVKIERFMGARRTDVENNNTAAAASVRVSTRDGSASPLDFTGFENLLNDGVNNYSERLSGWFIPPTTGNYVFFVASDDDSDVFLSTDNNPANKVLIAQESGWGNAREWTNNAGGSILSQKRSDQWTNDLGVAPYASGIALTAGNPYYIEAVHHQGIGGENVGVLAKLVTDPDPTNGTPPIPSSQLMLASYAPTKLNWTSEPKSVTVFENGAAMFTAGATSDGELNVLYQWQRNGTNIPGATISAYSIQSTIAADSGAKFSVIAATPEGGFSITSTNAVLTVQQAAFEQGLALMQYWPNQTAASPEGTPPLGPPAFSMAVPAFEAGVNGENGDNYVNEVSGFFIPAVSGYYDFIVTGDDNVDLFLSTDSNPNNKRLICQEPGWSGALTWGTDGGGGNGVPQKHSATWTNANSANLAPFANGIQLTAGTKYYIEMWHHEGGGGDNCAATFTMRTGGVAAPDPADGTGSAITGNLLGFNTPAAHYVDFTQQPTNATALSATTATFSAAGVSDGTLPIGTTGLFELTAGLSATDPTNFVKFPVVLFQWYKDGTLIPGATTSTYTTPPLKPADNNAQYVAAIRALGYLTWSNSTPAVVTVITDTNKPTFFAAEFDQAGLPVISVSFSKMMDLASISKLANYTVTGGGASFWDLVVNTNDLRHVQLKLVSAPTGPFTLTIAGITDFSGNAPVGSTVNVALDGLVNVDIGDFALPDPAWPGSLWRDSESGYTVECQGSDIWASGDGFNFSYESKTNDFDVVARQMTFTKVSNWSKGGLMAREDLTLLSRNWNIVNDPTSANGINAIDGSGLGANTVESNCRSTNGQASVSWATGPATIPAYPNAWVRLKRTGQILHSFWSSNGVQWVQEGMADISTNVNGPLPASLYVGICCTAHANNSTAATDLNYYYTASFADYNSAYAAPTNVTPATLSASVSGGNIVISWTPAGGTLQASPSLGTGATWTPVGTANPATVQLSGNAKFFRVGP